MSDETKQPQRQWTPYFEISAVGQRLGLTSCRLCGAAVVIGDRDFNAVKAHEAWHER